MQDTRWGEPGVCWPWACRPEADRGMLGCFLPSAFLPWDCVTSIPGQLFPPQWDVSGNTLLHTQCVSHTCCSVKLTVKPDGHREHLPPDPHANRKHSFLHTKSPPTWNQAFPGFFLLIIDLSPLILSSEEISQIAASPSTGLLTMRFCSSLHLPHSQATSSRASTAETTRTNKVTRISGRRRQLELSFSLLLSMHT